MNSTSNSTAKREPCAQLTNKLPAGLLAHYAAIFKAAWAARSELAGPKRLADEYAFLPAALALQETPPHPASRRAAIVICVLMVAVIVWAYFSQLDIVATAHGRIKVSDGSKLIQALDTSVVKAIHVKDGDKVQAGALLIELDATLPAAESTRVQQEQQATLAELLRAQGLLAAITNHTQPALAEQFIHATLEPTMSKAAAEQLGTEWNDINAKLSRLRAETSRRQAELHTVEQQIAKLQATLPLLVQREHDYQALTKQGFVSQHAGQDRTLERVSQERDLATLIARRSEALATIREGQEAAHAYHTETLRNLQERMAQAELKFKQLVESAIKAQQRKELTRLTAPVTGTVQQLAIHTAGGVVTPAQALMVVVPIEADVMADVTLENKDVGFVREGQSAEIKLEAFPYTSYGTVQAEVASISADAAIDEKKGAVFAVTLALKKTAIVVNGKRFKLVPGMNLVAELKTGKRTVLEYLLQPIRQLSDQSLKER